MAILKCRAVCGTQAEANVWGTMGGARLGLGRVSVYASYLWRVCV